MFIPAGEPGRHLHKRTHLCWDTCSLAELQRVSAANDADSRKKNSSQGYNNWSNKQSNGGIINFIPDIYGVNLNPAPTSGLNRQLHVAAG